MQYPFSCTPAVHTEIENAVSTARLSRYMPAAKGDRNLALRLYVWNARICESFYFPCQMLEVTVRNALASSLRSYFKNKPWYENGLFTSQLPRRSIEDLDSVIRDKRKDHGRALSENHIIAGLSFGFWMQTMTKNYENIGLWPSGISIAFPKAPVVSLKECYDKIDGIRNFRNRAAHHYAVFDKSPSKSYNNILDVLGWVSPSTKWYVEQVSRVSQAIGARPQF